jgi:adenine-specific DNA-methyltransferase
MAAKTKLELTWVGKEIRPRLEPRILIEEPTLSYHAKARRDSDIFDNLLIHGDNLLALKALETDPAVRGKVKCVYIDPPFNTGAAFDHYDDGLEHSVWLSLMFERVQIIHSLLSKTGVLFVHLDDNELDYMKITLDQVFGRGNFVNRITIDARAPSAFSTVNPGVFKASEYILLYAKDRSLFEEGSGRVPREPDYAYNMWITNPEDEFGAWRFSAIMEAYDKQPKPRSRHPRKILEHFNAFMVENAARICRLASISDTGAGEAIVSLKQESLRFPGKIFRLQRGKGLDDVYVLDGQQLIFYSKNISVVDGEPKATKLLTNIWTDIAWEGIANEGGVKFKKGKKPEKLIRRCIELSTRPGDLVLDSFAGSGTTGAVAHKMGRRWIMVELGDHAQTHIVPRMRKVIDGADNSGVTEAVGWKGGGGYRFARLAPSLLEKDAWGNWVIRKEYNPAMLAEAMCKHFNYTYAPSTEHFWMHGYSSETSYIYVTTNSLTGEQLRALSEEVGEHRSLLICCKAFEEQSARSLNNLTIRKIPGAVLDRCEWGKDDYSLKIESLPMMQEDEGDDLRLAPKRNGKKDAATGDFSSDEEEG